MTTDARAKGVPRHPLFFFADTVTKKSPSNLHDLKDSLFVFSGQWIPQSKKPSVQVHPQGVYLTLNLSVLRDWVHPSITLSICQIYLSVSLFITYIEYYQSYS